MHEKIKKIVVAGFFAFLMILNVGAQWDGEPPPLKDRLFFGGNFALSFGNATSIVVSPLAGYQITPKLAGGVGLRYEYFRYDYPGYVPYDTHIFGGSVFGRYMIINSISEALGLGGFNSGIFLQAEYEMLSLESQYFDLTNPNADGRFYLHSMLIGGGLFQPIGRKGGFLITVLWNLNESYNSIYANPILRFGFNF